MLRLQQDPRFSPPSLAPSEQVAHAEAVPRRVGRRVEPDPLATQRQQEHAPFTVAMQRREASRRLDDTLGPRAKPRAPSAPFASLFVLAGARTEAGKAGQQDDYGAVWDAVEALPARWRAALFTDAVQ